MNSLGTGVSESTGGGQVASGARRGIGLRDEAGAGYGQIARGLNSQRVACGGGVESAGEVKGAVIDIGGDRVVGSESIA